MKVHRTPALHPFPDLTQPDVAFPRYPAGEIDPNLVVRCAMGRGGGCFFSSSSTHRLETRRGHASQRASAHTQHRLLLPLVSWGSLAAG